LEKGRNSRLRPDRINQTESDVENLDRPQVIAYTDDRANHIEGYMENVV
jgi:hypothetical protein